MVEAASPVESDVVASVAVSLDGFIAEVDGGVDFLEKYQMEDFDFDSWVAEIGALIMGSTTYLQAVEWGWTWGDLPTVVLTTRTDLAVPKGADIEFRNEPTAEAISRFSAETPKRLWVFGGGQVITEALNAGVVDTLDIMVMPEALGGGLPLFTAGYQGPMELVEAVPHANGAVRLVYRPEMLR